MGDLLILTPQVPYPPRQGTALRNWGILRGLAAHHRVSLLSFAAPDQEADIAPTLADLVARVATVPQPARGLADRLRTLITTARPDLAGRLASDAFREQLAAWLQAHTFDGVVVEGLELAPYLDVVWARENSPRVVFDDHNCEYLLQKRAAASDWGRPARWSAALYSEIQWRRLRAYEAEVCRRADLVVAVSAADAAALCQIVPTLAPVVIPNGITVADYADYAGNADFFQLEQPAFVFTGTMDFRPNVDGVLWFAEEVWPRIRAALPGAHLYVVGRRPHARLQTLRAEDGLIVTGGVPDTRPYIDAATVYVVPLLVGGGTRLKILEATAMGKPMVATTLGAEGFDSPGQAMRLADTPDAFASACIDLARDTAARKRLATQARAFAYRYDWERLLPPLLDRLSLTPASPDRPVKHRLRSE